MVTNGPDILYGSVALGPFVPEGADAHLLRPEECALVPFDLGEELDRALSSPLGTAPLAELVEKVYAPGLSILVLVDDHSRPNQHTRLLLPLLRDRLLAYGVQDEDISIMVASGTHAPPPPEMIERTILTPELAATFIGRVLCHDCDRDIEHIGTTSQGTPVGLDVRVLGSALVIPLTDSEYHYFAGQAGTVKSICPGVASRKTININHARMFDPEHGFVPTCRLGGTEGNPVILDIMEIARMVGEKVPVFGIDCVVDCGSIVHLAAGELASLHAAATPVLARLRVACADGPGDIVVVSAGAQGLNLYQAAKAVHCGWNAVRKDGQGHIVVLAPCPEGVGNEAFTATMDDVRTLPPRKAMAEVIATRCGPDTFRIGNQKPVDLLRIIDTVGEGRIHIITGMDPDTLRNTFRMDGIPAGARPARALHDALSRFIQEYDRPRIYIIEDPSVLVQLSGS